MNVDIPMKIPHIVCLCGSTRFLAALTKANRDFTLEGKIVLAPGVIKSKRIQNKITKEQAEKLDELHLRKIDLADSVFIVNPNGYIGESTRKEIQYAEQYGKPISYLESK